MSGVPGAVGLKEPRAKERSGAGEARPTEAFGKREHDRSCGLGVARESRCVDDRHCFAEPSGNLGQQPGLADPRLACDQECVPRTSQSFVPPPHREVEGLRPPHKHGAHPAIATRIPDHGVSIGEPRSADQTALIGRMTDAW